MSEGVRGPRQGLRGQCLGCVPSLFEHAHGQCTPMGTDPLHTVVYADGSARRRHAVERGVASWLDASLAQSFHGSRPTGVGLGDVRIVLEHSLRQSHSLHLPHGAPPCVT